MIQVLSFEEWDASQDQSKLMEWGSTNQEKDSTVIHKKVPYKDVPEEVRHMFYSQYVHSVTNHNGTKLNGI
jgi:hypothetical protein